MSKIIEKNKDTVAGSSQTSELNEELTRSSLSPEGDSKGSELFNQLIGLSGVPALRQELTVVLERKGIDINQLTLDELRNVVASYLREIMGSLLDGNSKKSKPEQTH